MKKTDNFQTSTGETVTISRAEYEKFLGQEQQLLAQNERLEKMERQVELLVEALRLARHKQFGASSEKSEDTLTEQLSFLFNEAEVFSAAEKETEENITVVLLFFIAGVNTMVMYWVRCGCRTPVEELAQKLVRLIHSPLLKEP